MKYIIKMYKGAMTAPQKILAQTEVEAKSPVDAEVIKEVYKTIENNGFRADNYVRWLGPVEDGSYHIDFGSWSTFVSIGAKEEK